MWMIAPAPMMAGLFGGLQMPELIIILIIALIIFGPKSLPKIGSAIGSAIREFKKSSAALTEEAEAEPVRPAVPASATVSSPPVKPPENQVSRGAEGAAQGESAPVAPSAQPKVS